VVRSIYRANKSKK